MISIEEDTQRVVLRNNSAIVRGNRSLEFTRLYRDQLPTPTRIRLSQR